MWGKHTKGYEGCLGIPLFFDEMRCIMQLEFKVVGQTLTWVNNNIKIVANSKGYLKAHFILSPEYKGLVSAHFTIYDNGVKKGESVTLDENFTCQVPDGVIKPDTLYVSLSCTDDNLFIPTNDALVKVEKSGVPDELLPTPDGKENQFEEFQRMYGEVLENAVNVETIATNSKLAEDNAKLSEENAKLSELNAKLSEENARLSETNSKTSESVVAQAMADYLAMIGKDIATLTNGKLTPSQLPPLAINDTFTVANTDEMLSLTAERGDCAIIVDGDIIKASYILASDSPSNLADWKQLGTSYVAEAGHSQTSDFAENSNMINGHRLVEMTPEQFTNAIKDAETYYLVG